MDHPTAELLTTKANPRKYRKDGSIWLFVEHVSIIADKMLFIIVIE